MFSLKKTSWPQSLAMPLNPVSWTCPPLVLLVLCSCPAVVLWPHWPTLCPLLVLLVSSSCVLVLLFSSCVSRGRIRSLGAFLGRPEPLLVNSVGDREVSAPRAGTARYRVYHNFKADEAAKAALQSFSPEFLSHHNTVSEQYLHSRNCH